MRTDEIEAMRTIFEMSLADLQQAALRTRNLAASLPLFEDDPCDCGNNPLHAIEPGYERWTDVRIEGEDEDEDVPPVFHAFTDGWDDMAEHGYFEYLICLPEMGGCGKVWRIPPDLEWD